MNAIPLLPLLSALALAVTTGAVWLLQEATGAMRTQLRKPRFAASPTVELQSGLTTAQSAAAEASNDFSELAKAA